MIGKSISEWWKSVGKQMSIDAHLREGNENGLKIRNSFLLAKKAKEAPNFSKSFFFFEKKSQFLQLSGQRKWDIEWETEKKM